MPNAYTRTKRACYFAYLAMSSVFSLPALLFVTFREMYGISYTLLGTLVLVNFCTQLGIDLVFTFFTKRFKNKKTISINKRRIFRGTTLIAYLNNATLTL